MAELTRYASFIVRLWRESTGDAVDAEGPAVWMGEMESIQTGRALRFQGLESLPALLAAQLADNLSTLSNPMEHLE